ncbi:hypothetical protein V8F20_010065 [Naviculisporaceae sp. PSN 640]
MYIFSFVHLFIFSFLFVLTFSLQRSSPVPLSFSFCSFSVSFGETPSEAKKSWRSWRRGLFLAWAKPRRARSRGLGRKRTDR